MGDEHAVEGTAMVPVERAGGLRVGRVDREFPEARVRRRSLRRTIVSKLAEAPFDRDLPERGRADIDRDIRAPDDDGRLGRAA
jgi:hypothetical protein